MSQFFNNFEEERAETRKSTLKHHVFEEESSEENTKLTKKEKKLNELRASVLNLEDGYTQKEIDNFLKNIKKYENLLKTRFPDFLFDFFNKIKNESISKASKKKIETIIREYKKENEDIEEEYNIGFDEEMKKIYQMDDKKKKIEKLLGLKKLSEEQIIKRDLALLETCCVEIQKEDFKKIIEIILQLSAKLKTEIIYKGENLNKYFESIIPLIIKRLFTILESPKDIEPLLFVLKEFDVNGILERKYFEYKFFVLNENPQTENKIYKLLNIIRSGDYNGSKQYYIDHSDVYSEGRDIMKILKELGMLAFYKNDFSFSSKILQKCYLNGMKEIENILCAACIFLEEGEVNKLEFYKTFVKLSKCMERNKFIFKSGNKLNEIFRAYFYSVNSDYEMAYKIIHSLFPNLNRNEKGIDTI